MTTLETAALLSLAGMVLRAGRRRFLNLSFALLLALLALWVLLGFLHCLVEEPGDAYVTRIFHAAYALGSLIACALFIFGLSFLHGGRPVSAWLLLATPATSLFAALSAGGLVIRAASFERGHFSVSYGPFYVPYLVHAALSAGGGPYCVVLKRSRSSGIDRARATYILLGFGVLLLSAVIVAAVLPGLAVNYDTSDYLYFLVILPMAFTAYAILRHRLPDVRLAIRRSFTYLLTTLLFGAPLLFFYPLFRSSHASSFRLETGPTAATLALAVAYAPAALRIAGALASRLFFPGLYDDVELLRETSAVFNNIADVREGL
ncbi:MAG: hypothetical protein QME88_02350 [Actinomycetota bacterium]|nr:hypothetical protein [Actinomycetota bacterium]